MARRITSRSLIGRADQVAALRRATRGTDAGAARLVLVAGDAGIGKSRLVAEAVAQARTDGLIAAVGGCVQLGEVSVAFAPLAEALRDLRAQLDAAGLGAVLPEPGALLGDPGSSRGSGPLFERVLGFLTELAQARPVLLVFEDLHWADASTRDLVTYLGRNLRDSRVTLVLTYRGDELHRRHPLRPVLADLDRDARVERLELVGLGADELTQLLTEICDEPPSATEVADLLARTGGNPFYIEELIASGPLDGGLPETVADAILDRIAQLSAQAQAVLHAAAVVDDEVDDELIAAVTGEPVGEVTAALREAIGHQVLVLADSSCRFRHALVREALYDDLLPGERARLHVAAAQAIERTQSMPAHTRWARLAHHWDAARDAPRAFGAAVRAAAEAERVHAYADAAEQYERALALRDQVPDADERAAMNRVELLLRASDAVQAGARSRTGLVLAEAALQELGEDAEPEQRAMVYERIGRINWTLHRGPAAVAAYERGAALVADRPVSREKAFVLSALGQSLMLRQFYRDAKAVLEQAIEVAAQASAPDVEGHAQCSLGPCLVGLGKVDAGLGAIRRALTLTGEFGTSDEMSRAYTNLLHSLYAGGRYDEIEAAAAEAVEYVVRTGHARHYGEAVAGNAIAGLFCAGRWAEAERLHSDPRVPKGDSYQELRWLDLPFATGRLGEARTLVADVLASTADADDVQFRAAALLRAAQLATVDREWDDARAFVAGALQLAERTDDQFYRALAYRRALGAQADRAELARDRQDEAELAEVAAAADALLADARRFAEERAAEGVALLPEPRGWLATAEAEHARALGRADGRTWSEVAAIWDDIGHPYAAAAARYRQADALLRERADRVAAQAVAREVLVAAEGLGAVPLADEVRALARRARFDLGRADEALPADQEPARGEQLDVTPRELEVLRLLAEGRTNRQIGTALFISEKTASVHVTNLLRKLGVANRVEAAGVAMRAGVA